MSERDWKPCAVAACDRAARKQGLCKAHLQRKFRGLPMDTPIRVYRPRGSPRPVCSAFRCARPVKTRELCAGHYRRRFTKGMPDWNRPLKLYRPKGQTKDVSVRMSRADWMVLKQQATGLRRDLSEHLRIILEEHARRMREAA